MFLQHEKKRVWKHICHHLSPSLRNSGSVSVKMAAVGGNVRGSVRFTSRVWALDEKALGAPQKNQLLADVLYQECSLAMVVHVLAVVDKLARELVFIGFRS